MRLSTLFLTLLTWSVVSRDAGGKPIEMDETLIDVVTKALGGSDQDKTEALSIILELLAEIDLPSLCRSISGKSPQFTRVDDIINSAATAYGATTPPSSAEYKEKLGTKLAATLDDKDIAQFTKGLPLDEASMGDILKTSYQTGNVHNTKPYAQSRQTVSDDYNYYTKIHPLPQEYPDYSIMLPGNSQYDFFDVSDNLVYDITAAASSPNSDVTKGGTMDHTAARDASAVFFPDGLLALSTIADDKTKLDDVIIRGSESLKSDAQLYAANRKMDPMRNAVDYTSTVAATNDDYLDQDVTTPVMPAASSVENVTSSYNVTDMNVVDREDNSTSSTVVTEGNNVTSNVIVTLSSNITQENITSSSNVTENTITLTEENTTSSANVTEASNTTDAEMTTFTDVTNADDITTKMDNKITTTTISTETTSQGNDTSEDPEAYIADPLNTTLTSPNDTDSASNHSASDMNTTQASRSSSSSASTSTTTTSTTTTTTTTNATTTGDSTAIDSDITTAPKNNVTNSDATDINTTDINSTGSITTGKNSTTEATSTTTTAATSTTTTTTATSEGLSLQGNTTEANRAAHATEIAENNTTTQKPLTAEDIKGNFTDKATIRSDLYHSLKIDMLTTDFETTESKVTHSDPAFNYNTQKDEDTNKVTHSEPAITYNTAKHEDTSKVTHSEPTFSYNTPKDNETNKVSQPPQSSNTDSENVKITTMSLNATTKLEAHSMKRANESSLNETELETAATDTVQSTDSPLNSAGSGLAAYQLAAFKETTLDIEATNTAQNAADVTDSEATNTAQNATDVTDSEATNTTQNATDVTGSEATNTTQNATDVTDSEATNTTQNASDVTDSEATNTTQNASDVTDSEATNTTQNAADVTDSEATNTTQNSTNVKDTIDLKGSNATEGTTMLNTTLDVSTATNETATAQTTSENSTSFEATDASGPTDHNTSSETQEITTYSSTAAETITPSTPTTTTTTSSPTTTTTTTTTTTQFADISTTPLNLKPELQWWKPHPQAEHVKEILAEKSLEDKEEEEHKRKMVLREGEEQVEEEYTRRTVSAGNREKEEYERKKVSAEPFTQWSGTEYQDKWSSFNLNRLASNKHTAGNFFNADIARPNYYGDKKASYPRYSVDLTENSSHPPRWGSYLNALYTRPSVDSRKDGYLDTTTARSVNTQDKYSDGFGSSAKTKDTYSNRFGSSANTKDKYNDGFGSSAKTKDTYSGRYGGSAKTKDIHNDGFGSSGLLKSKMVSPVRYHPAFDHAKAAPRSWSPFNPQMIVPNLGTLWGINPDPRVPSYDHRLRRYQKFHDQSKGSDSKYIVPSAKSLKAKAEQRSGHNEVSYNVKDDGSKLSQTDLDHLGVKQKTLWSEAASTSRLSPGKNKGYACPGLFGYFGDIMDCRSFFICSWGVPYRFHCPSGTLWNPDQSVCDWARNVQCSPK